MPTENHDNSWIAEKIMAQEDKLMEILEGRRNGEHEDNEPAPADLSNYPEPTPIDMDAEKQAFTELVQFLTDNPEDDCEFTALDPNAFADPVCNVIDVNPKE